MRTLGQIYYDIDKEEEVIKKITVAKKLVKLDSNELQILGMLAKEHGHNDLYSKCCTMMFQNLRVVHSFEHIYSTLFRLYKGGALARGATEDEANRIANIGAVRNTDIEWRKQFDNSTKTS